MKKSNKIKVGFIILVMLLAVVSCTADDPSDMADMTTSQPQIQSETEKADLNGPFEVAKTEVSTLAELPFDGDTALLTGAPVGSSPRFYKFFDGLTYYVYDGYAKTVYECTLSLPLGFTDGNIVFISGGAGSGEVFIGVKASCGGETVYLDYYFFSGNSVSEPLSVYLHDERAMPYLDSLSG